MEPLVTCQFSGTCLQSQNFGENLDLFWLWNDQFRKQISRVLFGICSAYIYSFDRFFGLLSSDVYEYFVTFAVFELEERMQKNLWKFAKNLTLMDRHKNTRGLSTLGCGQYYSPKSPLSNDKKSSCARLRHPNKIFNSLMTYLILRTSANLRVR
jgi:hypothetical protein